MSGTNEDSSDEEPISNNLDSIEVSPDSSMVSNRSFPSEELPPVPSVVDEMGTPINRMTAQQPEDRSISPLDRASIPRVPSSTPIEETVGQGKPMIKL